MSLYFLFAIGLLVVLLWVKYDDAFSRISFSFRTEFGKTGGKAVIPKPRAKYPVVIFLYGAGGDLMRSGDVLRQIAELGCAAVAIEYDQNDQLHFNQEMLGLYQYLLKQSWVQSNSIAWVARSLGAQCSLSFLLTHPQMQPQVYVRIAGGMVDQVGSNQSLSAIRCPVLLVHGDADEVFPPTECTQLAEMLTKNGIHVETRVLSGLPHNFGNVSKVIMRAVGEYCLARLPPTDYAAIFPDCHLTEKERKRFNVAMMRAGSNRRELWDAVNSLPEPEQRTAMVVIGGMEDYDLTHYSSAHLRQVIKIAWKARRTYSWCRDTPIELFERFVASPRVFDEPLEAIQSTFYNRLKRHLKYCRTVAEASDTVAAWKLERLIQNKERPFSNATPLEVLEYEDREDNCQHLILLYTYLARSVGIPIRPVITPWPTRTVVHYWVEIWDTQKKDWHSVDAAALDRDYHFNWYFNVAKAATHTTTGERGIWNAEQEGRWEAYTNTVGRFYPSGTVLVRVLEEGIAKVNQRVNVQSWLEERDVPAQLINVTSAKTDERGEVRFTLGQSAKAPYRFALNNSSQADWQWLAVHAGKHYEIHLNAKRVKSYDVHEKPPPLEFPSWPPKPKAVTKIFKSKPR